MAQLTIRGYKISSREDIELEREIKAEEFYIREMLKKREQIKISGDDTYENNPYKE